jgi:hypothetical protein
MRPNAKVLETPPHPTVRAPVLYPTAGRRVIRPLEGNMTETSDSELVSTRQRRIAQLAKQMPEKGLTSLNQHLDLAWLREA